MNDNSELSSTLVAELLAKHWTENRPIYERPQAALSAWWLRRSGCARLEQHWYRLASPDSLARRWAPLEAIEADEEGAFARRTLGPVHLYGA